MYDDDTVTAYHEAGHAVIAYALGGHIESMQLGGEADRWLPARYGDCRVNWGPVDPAVNWQQQREIMAILAGPVAEMVYRSETIHPAHYGPWQHDWQYAESIAESMIRDPTQRALVLERLIGQLHKLVGDQACWPAIAALADELLAHQTLDREQIEEVIGFWFRQIQ